MRAKLKLEIVVEVESYEYDSIDSIIDEFSTETDYSFSDTDTIKVLSTEFIDCHPTK